MTPPADDYVTLCEESVKLPDVFEFLARAGSLTPQEVLDVVLVDQYQRWKQGQTIPVEHYIQRLPELSANQVTPLLIEEYGYLEERGVAPLPAEFAARYRSLGDSVFALLCEELNVSMDESGSESSVETDQEVASDDGVSRQIGRYDVICSIGKGAFGEVFLGKDLVLDRSVAIKVPTRERIQLGGGTEALLNEARTVAKLDHPNIVPVYDYGQTEDSGCYIVSKYVRGKDLRSESRKAMPHAEAAQIVALLARALQTAHSAGVIHRDVKPANILLNAQRQPQLLDFGLALRHRGDAAKGVYVGTPAYMSPEQMRGEGDSVDGRTDIYSLGIVFYELLSRRRPFATPQDLSTPPTVQTLSPQPPRQFVESIPRELERICLKALAFHPTDRYNTAGDFAEDLEAWLAAPKSAGSEKVPPQTDETFADVPTVKFTLFSQEVSEEPQSGPPSARIVGGSEPSTRAVVSPSSSQSSSAKRRWAVAGTTVALVVVATLVFYQWSGSRSAVRRFSEEYLPEFARGYLTGGWHLKPDYETGYFYRSEPLLAAAQQADASVKSVAVKTTAPRYKPVQVTWSPQGDRLAVVTRRGQLRLYQWDGRRLELRTVYRAETSDDWVRCFRWHPFDGSAVIATGRGIVIGKYSDRGDYDIALLTAKLYETTSIHSLVDKGHVLFVFTSNTGVRAWDPLTETVYENFLPTSAQSFTSTGLSNQYVLSTEMVDGQPSTLEFWEATWGESKTSTQSDADVGKANRWQFARQRSVALDSSEPNEGNLVKALRLTDDQTHLAVVRNDSITLHRIGEALVKVGDVSLVANREQTAACQFLPSNWPQQRNGSVGPSLVWGDGPKMHCGELLSAAPSDSEPRDGEPTFDALTTEMLGAKLEDSVFDAHPANDLIAVAFAGGLEVWNSRLQTVSKVPSVDCVWDVVPLQLHDKCLLVRRDGGGIIIRTRGEPLGRPLPPVEAEYSQLGIVQHNSVVEPELEIIQSTYQSSLPPSRRNLTGYGIVATTTTSRHTFSMVPHQVFVDRLGEPASRPTPNPSMWQFGTTYDPTGPGDPSQINRHFHPVIANSAETTAVAQRAQKVVLCDAHGRCHIRRFGRFDEPPQVFDQLNVASQHLSITIDSDATTLFATTGSPGETKVAALDLTSGSSLWNHTLAGMENGANLVSLRNRLLVTSWFGWRWLDARSGQILSDVSPRSEHGIRHGQMRKHPLDETLLSWHRYGEVEPVAAWSNELDLQWFAFATSDGQWLILSAAGELLWEVTTDAPLVTRFVGPSPERYSPADWADDVNAMVYRPSDSLTLVRYHSDGRTTCRPFQPLTP